MKNILKNINKVFENRIRLAIMSILVVNEQVEFKQLKEILSLTDGNLASHIKALEKVEYIVTNKEFVHRKPKTTYQATKKGRDAFRKHIEALEALIRQQK